VLTGAAAGAPRARLAPCTRSTLNMAQQHNCSSVPPYTQRSTSCCFDTAVTSLPQTGAQTDCPFECRRRWTCPARRTLLLIKNCHQPAADRRSDCLIDRPAASGAGAGPDWLAGPGLPQPRVRAGAPAARPPPAAHPAAARGHACLTCAKPHVRCGDAAVHLQPAAQRAAEWGLRRPNPQKPGRRSGSWCPCGAGGPAVCLPPGAGPGAACADAGLAVAGGQRADAPAGRAGRPGRAALPGPQRQRPGGTARRRPGAAQPAGAPRRFTCAQENRKLLEALPAGVLQLPSLQARPAASLKQRLAGGRACPHNEAAQPASRSRCCSRAAAAGGAARGRPAPAQPAGAPRRSSRTAAGEDSAGQRPAAAQPAGRPCRSSCGAVCARPSRRRAAGPRVRQCGRAGRALRGRALAQVLNLSRNPRRS